MILPTISIFGLLGNFASILVLRSYHLDMKVRLKIRNKLLKPMINIFQVTFRHILVMMAIFDTMFVLCMIISFSLPLTWETWKASVHPYLFPWVSPILQISLNGSIWSTVAIAMERFLSITHEPGAGR